ncbi:MAG: DEAD/DEAH box helicase [Baekduia sp.]
MPPARVTLFEEDKLVLLESGGDRELAAAFALVPGAFAYGPGQWTAPPSAPVAARLRELRGGGLAFDLSGETAQWLDAGPAPRFAVPEGLAPAEPEAPPAPPPLEVEEDPEEQVEEEPEAEPELPAGPTGELDVADRRGVLTLVCLPYEDARVAAAFEARVAPMLRLHRRDDPNAKVLPIDAWRPETLDRVLDELRLVLTEEAERRLDAVLVGGAERERIAEMSRAHDALLEVPGLDGELMPFQRAGVAYLLERRRTFLADEQGLGKTVQALAAIEAAGAYPAVIICPASLKLNWLREAGRWLPQRRAVAISGGAEQPLDGVEIVVLNYEITGRHLDALEAIRPGALILDEAHYVKSPKAARTQAVQELSARLSADAMRVALTGTPVVNHPAELAPQLAAIGRLTEFGSMASFERRYSKARTRRELHERLRASCYVRRRKDEVLTQLPAKQRAIVTMPLENEAEYVRAEKQFVAWLRDQERDEDGQLSGALRAQAMTKMTALRRLAAEQKLTAALSWIEDFTASDERLVVFAHHRAIQQAVAERFPGCARILGTDKPEERQAQVQRFQAAGGPALCVCSMEAASHGFTLTAAANVAFLELAWTPAKHDQAEDRIHRIGQDRGVTAWYLLAAGTIDERIARLLDEKRVVVDAVADGVESEGRALVGALLQEMAG